MKRLLLIVGALLLFTGVSFAFFTSSMSLGGEGSKTIGTTATNIGDTKIAIEGELGLNATDFYVGHKSIAILQVTASENEDLVAYNLTWKGNMELSELDFSVYKTETKIEVTSECEKNSTVLDGKQYLTEECSINNIGSLGEEISSGTIKKGDSEINLVNAEVINATTNGTTVYYYIVLEYPNLSDDQEDDIGKSFTGYVTVEESNAKTEITILETKIYDKDKGDYVTVPSVPIDGYKINLELSNCNNNVEVVGYEEEVLVNYLKGDTSCSLFFDIYDPEKLSRQTLLALGFNKSDVKSGTPSFASVTNSENSGIYKERDPLYDDAVEENEVNSYYFRGAVNNNWVTFAGKMWRIIRINGDGSLRLIYTGEGTTGTNLDGVVSSNGYRAMGTATQLNYNSSKTFYYNVPKDLSYYVGWTYTDSLQRPTDSYNSGTSTKSKAYDLLNTWFNDDSIFTDSDRGKVANGYFCNDRSTEDGESWEKAPDTSFNYSAYSRLIDKKTPTLGCGTHEDGKVSLSIDASDGDVYTTKVGLITADEAVLAGAVSGVNNMNYYLYTGEYYWTISPSRWSSSDGYAYVFMVNTSISSGSVNGYWGIRPVINLNAGLTFLGTGLYDDPFYVS